MNTDYKTRKTQWSLKWTFGILCCYLITEITCTSWCNYFCLYNRSRIEWVCTLEERSCQYMNFYPNQLIIPPYFVFNQKQEGQQNLVPGNGKLCSIEKQNAVSLTNCNFNYIVQHLFEWKSKFFIQEKSILIIFLAQTSVKAQSCLRVYLVPEGGSVVILTVDSAFYQQTCLYLVAVTEVRCLPKSPYLQVHLSSYKATM